MPISRKKFVRSCVLLASVLLKPFSVFAAAGESIPVSPVYKRVRPSDAAWPSPKNWDELGKLLNGNLIKLKSPFTAGNESLFKDIKNPYFNNSHPAVTQSLGWVDAWRCEPSIYVVAAKTSADVAAAIKFAGEHHLRVVVKGGGHSYQGNSCAADSLLIWTHEMQAIAMLDEFTAEGCGATQKAQPAVSIEAGAIWAQAYNEVTTNHGKYVQGGGCMTVGVAGLIQSGGFGNFSKYYGMAAAGLLQAEIVLADGSVQIVNECQHPDLFWALKGGGGGSFGVVTKVVLRTRELPELFGAAFGRLKAASDESYEKLIEKILLQYRDHLFNPAWGESISFHSDRSVSVGLVFHGLNKEQAKESWKEFEEWTKADSSGCTWVQPLNIINLPARQMWDPAFLKKYAAGLISSDSTPGAPELNIYWTGDGEQSGQFLHGYHSGWLNQHLLKEENIQQLTNAFFETSRRWSFSLHFNKGLAGAPAAEKEAAANTAMNATVLDAFALLILAGEEGPALPGMSGHEPDMMDARKSAKTMRSAFEQLKKMVPLNGSYVSESDYFDENWQENFWGSNYQKLLAVKNTYDPEGLFFVHHGVGSESWSADGFTRIR